jgi:hypothetical protein
MLAVAFFVRVQNKKNMDLINEIKTVRQQEIQDNNNAWTVPPLYVVLDVVISVTEHNSDYSQSTSVFNYQDEYIRADDEGSEIEAETNTDTWNEPITIEDTEYRPVMRKGYHDRFITVCFTRKSAEEFIERERHNLSNPRIYVYGIPRRNIELVELGKLFGDVR